jgi:hypothetical protein
MRYLRLVILVSIFGFGLNTAVFAVCCPGGCVENGYGGCWLNGTNNYCAPTSLSSCQGSSGSSGGGSGGRGGGVVYPPPQPPGCVYLNKNTTAVWRAIRRCVKALSASAQRFGCSLEDATGRAEDQRTGLSCPARQAALASQCEARCWTFAVHQNNCESEDDLWRGVFGGIGGFSYGFARVDLCGPRLRSGFLNRTGRFNPQRLKP